MQEWSGKYYFQPQIDLIAKKYLEILVISYITGIMILNSKI